jgi:hypothetical protein
MRENRSYGSVRGALGDRRPYRDPGLWGAWRVTAGSTRMGFGRQTYSIIPVYQGQ